MTKRRSLVPHDALRAIRGRARDATQAQSRSVKSRVHQPSGTVREVGNRDAGELQN